MIFGRFYDQFQFRIVGSMVFFMHILFFTGEQIILGTSPTEGCRYPAENLREEAIWLLFKMMHWVYNR